MGKILEALWYDYQVEDSLKQSDEEKALLNTLVATEERLLAGLNEEQTCTLKALEDCLNDLECITDKNAFVRGVRFATGYLIEAMFGG